MRSATSGSGDNKGLSEKLDSEEKEKIMDALERGQSWLKSNPESDAEEIIAAQGNPIRAFVTPWEDIARRWLVCQTNQPCHSVARRWLVCVTNQP